MTQRDGSLVRFIEQRTGLTYTPGQPDEASMIYRLAVKAQATAVEFGVDLSWKDAVTRARHNLAYVRGLAGAKDGAK